MPLIADEAISTDEELIQSIASGRQEAVGPLYSRYAPTVLGMAAQALDRATAEEIVQDVFLAVWKNARSFDPTRGRYVWHCHILEHEDNEMMRPYDVVVP